MMGFKSHDLRQKLKNRVEFWDKTQNSGKVGQMFEMKTENFEIKTSQEEFEMTTSGSKSNFWDINLKIWGKK